MPRGRAVVARWVDKIYRYPRRRTALATLAGRLAGEFPIASEEMALFFHHLLSGHSAGADGVRANPATVDRTLATAYTATPHTGSTAVATAMSKSQTVLS